MNQPSASEHNHHKLSLQAIPQSIWPELYLRVCVLIKRLPPLFSSIHSILSDRSHTADYSSSILKVHIYSLFLPLLVFPPAHTHTAQGLKGAPAISSWHTDKHKKYFHLSLTALPESYSPVLYMLAIISMQSVNTFKSPGLYDRK